MQASLAVLLVALSIVAVLFFVPLEESTLRFDGNQLQVIIPAWRVFTFVVAISIGLSLFAAWEVVEAVIGMSRIRFEFAAPKTQRLSV